MSCEHRRSKAIHLSSHKKNNRAVAKDGPTAALPLIALGVCAFYLAIGNPLIRLITGHSQPAGIQNFPPGKTYYNYNYGLGPGWVCTTLPRANFCYRPAVPATQPQPKGAPNQAK